VKRSLLVIAMLVAGCGGAERGPYETVASTDEPRADLERYVERIAELQRDLDATLPATAGADELGQPRGDLPINASSRCLIAADVRDRICDLMERICSIAESEPDDSGVHEKCTRARDTCTEARERVAGACGEL